MVVGELVYFCTSFLYSALRKSLKKCFTNVHHQHRRFHSLSPQTTPEYYAIVAWPTTNMNLIVRKCQDKYLSHKITRQIKFHMNFIAIKRTNINTVIHKGFMVLFL